MARMLFQSATGACISVDGRTVAAYPLSELGLAVYLAFERNDNATILENLVTEILQVQVLTDESGRIVKSLKETGAHLLLIPQFTLVAKFSNSGRADFGEALGYRAANKLFDELCILLRSHLGERLHSGIFGADMTVTHTNCGPLSFIHSV